VTPYAIVVVGNERRFMGAARPFVRYLRTKVGARVSVIRGAYLAPDELSAALKGAIGVVPRDAPLLVAYLGHGLNGAWSFALEHQEKSLRLPYEQVAETLARHPGPLVVLNDCCHAESIVPHLEKAGITPDRCLVLSASKAEDVTIPGTAEEVEKQWAEGKVFETVIDSTTLYEIDMTPYVPPLPIRMGRRWKNAKIRLRNMLIKKGPREPTKIYVNSPPNGWAKHRETVTTYNFGLRWGAELDAPFLPKP
jgi:hypothetical protein